MAAQRVRRGEHPARVVLRDGELRGIPVDVGVGVEVAAHRALGERVQHVHVPGVLANLHVALPALDHSRAGHSKPPVGFTSGRSMYNGTAGIGYCPPPESGRQTQSLILRAWPTR